MKAYLLPLLSAGALLLTTACEKPAVEPTPDPVAEQTMFRTFAYTTANRDTAYAPGALTDGAYAFSEATKLTIGLGPKQGRDFLIVVIDNAELKPGYVGSYTAKTTDDAAAGPAFVRYSYQQPVPSGTRYALLFSSTTVVRGSLTVTAYDAQRRLLSGTYSFTFPQAYDPTRETNGLPNAPRCDVRISGSFSNVRVQPQ